MSLGCTGRGSRFGHAVCMAQHRRFLGIGIRALLTGIGDQSLLRAGRFLRNDCIVPVIRDRRRSLVIALAADRAGIGIVTFGGAGRRHRSADAKIMNLDFIDRFDRYTADVQRIGSPRADVAWLLRHFRFVDFRCLHRIWDLRYNLSIGNKFGRIRSR